MSEYIQERIHEKLIFMNLEGNKNTIKTNLSPSPRFFKATYEYTALSWCSQTEFRKGTVSIPLLGKFNSKEVGPQR